ncbi:hypothetical protein B0H19DRAFT_389669 [Mycena capillaripes]|nr:hypothetical protein B0H19DRAFT_389669 [Mycena capillaripes]
MRIIKVSCDCSPPKSRFRSPRSIFMSNPHDLVRRTNAEHDAELAGKLSEVQLRLEDTDSEIAGTLAHLERLRARRRDILVDRNALTSPILNLPPEIICEIFTRCLPPPHILPSARDAPLLLGQICRRWRSIVLSLPALWSSICVAAVLAESPRAGLLALLDLWLDRAGSSTLSLSIVLETENYDIMLEEMARGIARAPLFKKVCHSSHRWRELEIVRRLQDFPALLHHEDPWNLPELVKLTLLLTPNGRHSAAFPPNLLSSLIDAPALREVHLMGFTPDNLLLPWTQLTTVHSENLLPIECLQTLAQTTNLTDATFSLWPTKFFHLPNHAPIARPPHLTSLTLTGDLCTEILDHFDLPALVRFRLSVGPNNDFTPLTAFLVRSTTLRDVSLEVRGAVPTGDFISALEAMSAVETVALGVHTGLMNGPLPHALQTNLGLLPCVRRLTITERIDRYNERPVEEGAIVEMLRARWAGGGGLRAFCLVSTQVFRPVHAGFVALAKEGMGIELRSHGSGPFLTVYFNSAKVK